MKKVSLVDKLKYALVEPHYPNVGIEFNSNSLRIAAVANDKGTIRVQHFDSEELPAEVLEVNPFKPNIHALEVVSEALKSLWARNRFKSAKLCMLLQDRTALSFHVVLEHPATTREECLDLIRFKLRKSVPFRIEDAKISFFDASGNPQHRASTLWVNVMNHAVLQQYEQLVQTVLQSDCGLVDLTTFNLLNLAEKEIRSEGIQDEDILYVNLNRNYISVAITQKGKLTFFRSRSMNSQNGSMEEALAEIYPATMFYLDKLGGNSLSRAFVYSVENPDELAARMETTLQLKTAVVFPQFLSVTHFDPSSQRYLRVFAPLLGLLVSRKVEFL